MTSGTMLMVDDVELLREDAAVERVRFARRSPATPSRASAPRCYGLSLATHQLVELGEAVGVIAAQSIGEPGTQLTMRTFHSGGVTESDITHGLPRVVELFEARTPKGAAKVAEFSGVVRVELVGRERKVTVVGNDGEVQEESISIARHLLVEDGQEVEVGTPLHDGPLDPKLMMKFRGTRETQQYLVEEVQNVYRDQGVSIHDKHIELIVRQMTRRVQIVDAGESPWLPGAMVDVKLFNDTNDDIEANGKEAADGRAQLMGITKASLATDSWLSAASFQETTRVLTEAAIEGKRDHLVGLKENIIIGKLIPAGSGLEYYNQRELRLDMPDAELLPAWAQVSDDDLDLASLLGELSGDDSTFAPTCRRSRTSGPPPTTSPRCRRTTCPTPKTNSAVERSKSAPAAASGRRRASAFLGEVLPVAFADHVDGAIDDLEGALIVERIGRITQRRGPLLGFGHRILGHLGMIDVREYGEVDDTQCLVVAARRRPLHELVADARRHHHAPATQADVERVHRGEELGHT